MERKINNKIDNIFTSYKDTIRTDIIECISTIKSSFNHSNIQTTHDCKQIVEIEMMSLLQNLYDFPVLKLEKNDFLKRKRIKNFVPLYNRCNALRSNSEQCSRRRKIGDFCGTHCKGVPHGITTTLYDETESVIRYKQVSVWAQDIRGIIYYIDEKGNVYDTTAVEKAEANPKIIAKYVKILDNEGNIQYSIPDLNI